MDISKLSRPYPSAAHVTEEMCESSLFKSRKFPFEVADRSVCRRVPQQCCLSPPACYYVMTRAMSCDTLPLCWGWGVGVGGGGGCVCVCAAVIYVTAVLGVRGVGGGGEMGGGCVCVCVCRGVCVCGSPVLAVDARSARTSQAGHRLTEMFFTCLWVRVWFLSSGLDYKSHGWWWAKSIDRSHRSIGRRRPSLVKKSRLIVRQLRYLAGIEFKDFILGFRLLFYVPH